jgi:hypothetical protein
VREVMEQQGYLTEQGVLVVLKPFRVAQLEEALRRAVDMTVAPNPDAGADGAPIPRRRTTPRRTSRGSGS